MVENFPHAHFERYADDIAVHCCSYKQLKYVEREIRKSFVRCKLEPCSEKTKIVYCKDSSRCGDYPVQSFDFLDYTFRPRSTQDREGQFFISFSPAVSRKSLKAMREKVKQHPLIGKCFDKSIEEVAKAINPIIQGWINHYGKFRKSSLPAIYDYINERLMKWTRRKYKNLKQRKQRSEE